MTTEFTVASDRKIQVLNITEKCQNSIGGAKKGVAVFNLMHTTAAIMVGEDEPDLRDDIARVAEQWLADFHPFRHGRRYGAPNAEAHIISALTGTSLTIPIVDGKLLLGAWQSILLLELDGPRRRRLVCAIIETQV